MLTSYIHSSYRRVAKRCCSRKDFFNNATFYETLHVYILNIITLSEQWLVFLIEVLVENKIKRII